MPFSDPSELRLLPLFRTMDERNFTALMRTAYVQSFPPQVDLIAEGEPSDFLHLVVEGSVDLFAAWNGRESSIATVRPVTSFILAATVRDAPYLMSARTMEKSRIVMVPSAEVRAMIGRDGGFAGAVIGDLAYGYRRLVKKVKDLKLRSSVERLANHLLRQSRALGDARQFELSMEKRRLAALLGMTPENLSRAIRTLKAHGVEVDGVHVTLTSPERLERLARPTPLIDVPSV
jgi:CRP/FNR family transcriptional activator FtrB